MHPDHTKLLRKAQALDQAQKTMEASLTYQKFLALEPRHAEAWSNLSGKLLVLGDPQGAQTAARAALDLAPQTLAARINLGRALMQLNRIQEAEDHFTTAMKQDKGRLDSPMFLAECRLHQQDLRGAHQALATATSLAARPGRSEALVAHLAELWAIFSMGMSQEHRPEEAEAACATALRLNGRNFSAKFSLGMIQMTRGHLETAKERFRQLAKTHPHKVEVRLQLIACLARQGDFLAVGEEIAKLVHEKPRDLIVYRGVLEILYAHGRWSDLAAEIARYRLMDPTSIHPDLNQAFVDLLFGEFRLGWERHEARLRLPTEEWLPHRSFSQPTWAGEPFLGKTLLVWAEQGFGDTLMFLRYLPQVKALGGRVLVEVQAPLVGVAATCPGFDALVTREGGAPPFDLQVSLQSLPWLFRTELASIPGEIPYLQVPSEVPRKREILEQLALAEDKVRIGLVWAGSPLHSRDAERSLKADLLAPLEALPGVVWYSLQARREELPPLRNLVSLSPYLSSFSDTAYALSGLDLLITVDTAVVHLAGALGIPTLLLLTYQPDYRWLLDREDSPWYPTLHLYRQPAYGDWEAVIRRVVEDLTQG